MIENCVNCEDLLHACHRALSDMERQEDISALTMDGCPVEELGLVFTLPSYPYTKLRKEGR